MNCLNNLSKENGAGARAKTGEEVGVETKAGTRAETKVGLRIRLWDRTGKILLKWKPLTAPWSLVNTFFT